MAQLGRFNHTAANNLTGLPIASASVTIYREGATVNGAQSGTSPLAVTVRHIGKLKDGDTVFINTTTGTTYAAAITETTNLTVTLSGFTGTLSLADGDRLIPGNNLPTLYSDDQAGATKTNPLTTDANGLANCHIEAGAYDYIVSGGSPVSLSAQLYHAMVVPTEAPGQVRYADAFSAMPSTTTGGIQEAIDDLPTTGGKVICSAGKTYSISGASAATASLWLHSGTELIIPVGCTLQRATGSLTSSIGVICAGPKGSNGTEFSSGSTGSNIRISGGGIVDGNESNFTSNVGHGIRLKYVDGLNIEGVTIKNTEQDGIYLDGCRNFHIDKCNLDTVGQAASVTQRNGISVYNTGATSGWGQQGSISNLSIKTVGAAGASAVGEAVSLLDVANVTFSNITIDGCDYTLELNAHSTNSEWNRNLTFNNIVSKNARFTFIAMFDTVAATWRDIVFNNCMFEGHSTLHNGAVVWVNNGSTGTFDGLTFKGITARNINTSDTANRKFFQYASTTGAGSTGLVIEGCQFYGKSGTTVTSGGGIDLEGGITNALIANTIVKDVPGVGYSVGGISGVTSVARNVRFSNCIADTCTGNGWNITAGTATTTTSYVYCEGCVAKDCGISGNNASGWLLQTSVGAGAVLQNIYLRFCKALKTAGTFMVSGLKTNPTAGTTLDTIEIDHCDFDGMQTTDYDQAGSFAPTTFRVVGHRVGVQQTITAVGNAITLPSKIHNCTILLAADNSYTLTSAPTLAVGNFEGQRVLIINQDTVDTITIQDQGTLASSNLRLSANTIALAPRDSIELVWNSTIADWFQVGQTNVL